MRLAIVLLTFIWVSSVTVMGAWESGTMLGWFADSCLGRARTAAVGANKESDVVPQQPQSRSARAAAEMGEQRRPSRAAVPSPGMRANRVVLQSPRGLAEGRKTTADKGMRERNVDYQAKLAAAERLESDGYYLSLQRLHSSSARYYSEAARAYVALGKLERGFVAMGNVVTQQTAHAQACLFRGDFEDAARSFRSAAKACDRLEAYPRRGG